MEYLYPGGLAKAITFSYDDGQVYDRCLIEIFNQAGFKGTFHLNSGNLDKDGYVQKAELPTLYAEHEIACHGVTHRYNGMSAVKVKVLTVVIVVDMTSASCHYFYIE